MSAAQRTGHCAACDPYHEVAETVVSHYDGHDLCRECCELGLPAHLKGESTVDEPRTPQPGDKSECSCEDCLRFLPCTFREGVWLCRDCPSDDEGDRLRWGE